MSCFASCEKTGDNVVSPESFLNTEQEVLGDQMWDALTSAGTPFEILPKENNEVLYDHLQALYKQSYFILRAKQGWSTDRDWKIAIYVDENQAAYSFPGGNMLISTGMLKSFRKEYELFYLLSFENSLMDSGYLFANILTFVEDSIDVEKLIDEANEEKALRIGLNMLDRLEFNALITEEVDLSAMQWICESSNFRVDGISQFLPRLDQNSLWATSRISSIDRLSSVVDNFLDINCDNETRITSLGNNFYINEILPLIP